ncbi:MAG: hypothetical protein ACRD15_04780 [Vicinamibacterales bacterium]
MARRVSSPEIDRLYQLPLGEFITERNALAKRAGPDAADLRTLPKPTLPAWAVNQLFWTKRAIYDELLDRANDLRATHTAALRGQRADLRGANHAHDEAVNSALKATLALLVDSGSPVTDQTKQAIVTTLRALPSEEAPGRLSKPLQPRGFEVLGVAASRGRVRAAPAPLPPKPAKDPGDGAGKDQSGKAEAARIAAARDALATASRATREAEQLARRQEFEVARAARDADKAERRVAEAEASLRQAQIELDDARRAAATSSKARETVEGRARKAADQLANAKHREQAARRALEALS